MKKVIALVLALILMVSLTSCGGSDTKESDSDKTGNSAEQSEAVIETEQETHEKVNVPDKLVGTWRLLPEAFYQASGSGFPVDDSKKVLIPYENAVTEFTVSDDGIVTANGKEYYLYNSTGKEFENEDCGSFEEKFAFNMDEIKYLVYLNKDSDNSDFVVFEPIGDLAYQYRPIYSTKTYTKKTAELTVDNWQDIFEVKGKYGLSKDDWGDVNGIYGSFALHEKDNIIICSGFADANDWRIAYNCFVTETALIHIDKKTGEYTFTDRKTVSNEPREVESQFHTVIVEKGDEKSDGAEYYYDIGIPFGEINDLKETDNEYTAYVATKVDIEATRIKGTITYLSAE